MTDLQEIQIAIEKLSPDDRETLVNWLLADRKAWDEQIRRDFSEGGAGMKMLDDIDEQIRRGEFQPME